MIVYCKIIRKLQVNVQVIHNRTSVTHDTNAKRTVLHIQLHKKPLVLDLFLVSLINHKLIAKDFFFFFKSRECSLLCLLKII